MTREEALAHLNLSQELVAVGRRNRPGTPIKATSLTIHNTSNRGATANAKAHSRFVRETGFYLQDGKPRWVSWHFTVDDERTIQQLPLGEAAFHAGQAANGSSIAIEVCMHADVKQAVADDRAALLAAAILHDLGLPGSALKNHRDWTGKNCPELLLKKWPGFSAAVASYQTRLADIAGAILPGLATASFKGKLTSAEGQDADIDHDALASAMSPQSHVDRGDSASEFEARPLPGSSLALAQLATISLGDSGEGRIRFDDNDFPCLGKPGLAYTKDLTVRGELGIDKFRTRFSTEFNVEMPYAILIMGQRGIYVHEMPDNLEENGGPTQGCIHLAPGNARTFYDWVSRRTRIVIDYTW